MRFVLILLLGAFATAAGAEANRLDPTAVWQAWSAEAELHIYPDALEPIGVHVKSNGLRVADGSRLQFTDRGLGTLSFHAPFGNFEGFIGGRLLLEGTLEFSHAGHSVVVDDFELAADPEDSLRLVLNDREGLRLFTASHIHVYTDIERQQLVMERMDVRMSPELTERLGLPRWSDRFVGELALNASLHIPAGALTENRGDSCTDRPNWSTDGHRLDVLLIAMNQLSDRGSLVENGVDMEIITPSATLKNSPDLGTADVPWFRKFTGNFPPHNNDQHPYLIWNMYRIADGRLEQIGVSGVKHAFLTINVNCLINCGSGGVSGGNGHILWPGCEDVYGVGNNDSPGDLGPRHEINPRTGVFVSRGSFFDQNSDGVQDNSSSGIGENRLKVARSDLQTANADYLFEAWYVIRDDSNIFNTMGYRPTTPSGAGTSWSYGLGTFQQGPAVDEWVGPGGTPESGEMNVLFSAPQVGNFKVLARAVQLPDERWRYSYVVMNYDVDHDIDSFAVEAATSIDTPYFHDPDQDAANDWVLSTSGELRFDAPVGNPLSWGTAYSFGFDSDQPPVARSVRVSFGPTGPADVNLDVLGPDTGIL
ncbi:MAG: hypothetical protein ACPGJE_01165, partial [Wenzhouxiangellaceae bacterium]